MSAALVLAAPAFVLAGENQKSGPIGLAVILVLCVVSYLLFRSMSRHMRKVREEFPDGRDASATPGTATPGTATPGTAPPTSAPESPAVPADSDAGPHASDEDPPR